MTTQTHRRVIPWVGSAMGAAALVLLGVALVDVPSSPSGTPRVGAQGEAGLLFADLTTAGVHQNLRGELALKDPTPLFLPTGYNTGQVDPRMTQETAPGFSVGSVGAKLHFPSSANDLDFPDVVTLPDDALRTLRDLDQPVRVGELSRRDAMRAGLAPRAGLMQVLSIENGAVVYEEIVATSDGQTPMTAPVEAILAINSKGLRLRPTVLESSVGGAVDLEQVDLWLKEARLESILEPGFYRILFGP